MDKKIITVTMEKVKHIALIAHDGKKDELVEWVIKYKETLKNHVLYATGTTGAILKKKTGLDITIFNSGPLGGDQQIGSRIVEGEINIIIFLCDPLESQPHEPDVRALLRIAMVYDIPFANNLSTADFIMTSQFLDSEYSREIEDYKSAIQARMEKYME